MTTARGFFFKAERVVSEQHIVYIYWVGLVGGRGCSLVGCVRLCVVLGLDYFFFFVFVFVFRVILFVLEFLWGRVGGRGVLFSLRKSIVCSSDMHKSFALYFKTRLNLGFLSIKADNKPERRVAWRSSVQVLTFRADPVCRTEWPLWCRGKTSASSAGDTGIAPRSTRSSLSSDLTRPHSSSLLTRERKERGGGRKREEEGGGGMRERREGRTGWPVSVCCDWVT